MPYTECASRVPQGPGRHGGADGSFSQIDHAVIAANRNKFYDAMVAFGYNDRDPGLRG